MKDKNFIVCVCVCVCVCARARPSHTHIHIHTHKHTIKFFCLPSCLPFDKAIYRQRCFVTVQTIHIVHNATFPAVTTRRFVTMRRNNGDRETDKLTLIIQIQWKWQLFRLPSRRYIYPVHKLVILAQSHVFQVPCPSWHAASLRVNTVTFRYWGSLWTQAQAQAQVMQYEGHNRQGVVL